MPVSRVALAASAAAMILLNPTTPITATLLGDSGLRVLESAMLSSSYDSVTLTSDNLMCCNYPDG